MIRKFTLLGAASLVALAAACNSEDLSSPSRPGSAATAAEKESDAVFTYAVIGDMPYKKAKIDSFPQLIALINTDPRVEQVIHVGDIKAGSSPPAPIAYSDTIKRLFDTFEDPLVYTPGDNEWTDCHKYQEQRTVHADRRLLRVDGVLPRAGPDAGPASHAEVSTEAIDPAHRAYVENVAWKQVERRICHGQHHRQQQRRVPWFSDPATDMPADTGITPPRPKRRLTRARANDAWIARDIRLARQRARPARWSSPFRRTCGIPPSRRSRA